MKTFSDFLVEYYNALLLLEGKAQHQLIKQFGPKIVQKLIDEHNKQIQEAINKGHKVHFTDADGNVIGQSPNITDESAEVVKLQHPEIHAKNLTTSLERHPEETFREISKHLGIPEEPEFLNIKDSQHGQKWDQYVNWMLSRYATGGIESKEHMPKVLDSLEKYHNFVNSGDMNKDALGKWDKADKLHDSVTRTENKKNPFGGNIPKGSYTFVGENDHWIVGTPHTPEAACKMGIDTEWCTTSTYFDNYNSQGPLYVFIPKNRQNFQGNDGKNQDKYQLHYETDQFRRPDQKTMSREQINSILDRPFTGGTIPEAVVKMAHEALRKDKGEAYKNLVPSAGNVKDHVKDLLKLGHIDTVLNIDSNTITPEIASAILKSNKNTQDIKSKVISHIFDYNKSPEHIKSVIGNDTINHMIQNGNGKALLENYRGYQSYGIDVISKMDDMIDNFATTEKPNIAHKQTMDHIIDVMGGQGKKVFEKLINLKNPSADHSEILRRTIANNYDVLFGQGNSDPNLRKSYFETAMNHPSPSVRISTLQYAGQHVTPEHIKSTLTHFLQTPYERIRRVDHQGNEYVEDTSGMDASALATVIQRRIFGSSDESQKREMMDQIFGSKRHTELQAHLLNGLRGSYSPPDLSLKDEDIKRILSGKSEKLARAVIRYPKIKLKPEHYMAAVSNPSDEVAGAIIPDIRHSIESSLDDASNEEKLGKANDVINSILEKAMQHPHEEVRRAVAEYHFNHPGASDRLIDLGLNDTSTSVRTKAIEHGRNIKEQHINKIINDALAEAHDPTRAPKEKTQDLLVLMHNANARDKFNEQHINDMLKHKSYNVREAIFSGGYLPAALTTQHIVQGLKDNHDYVKEAALSAIERNPKMALKIASEHLPAGMQGTEIDTKELKKLFSQSMVGVMHHALHYSELRNATIRNPEVTSYSAIIKNINNAIDWHDTQFKNGDFRDISHGQRAGDLRTIRNRMYHAYLDGTHTVDHANKIVDKLHEDAKSGMDMSVDYDDRSDYIRLLNRLSKETYGRDSYGRDLASTSDNKTNEARNKLFDLSIDEVMHNRPNLKAREGLTTASAISDLVRTVDNPNKAVDYVKNIMDLEHAEKLNPGVYVDRPNIDDELGYSRNMYANILTNRNMTQEHYKDLYEHALKTKNSRMLHSLISSTRGSSAPNSPLRDHKFAEKMLEDSKQFDDSMADIKGAMQYHASKRLDYSDPKNFEKILNHEISESNLSDIIDNHQGVPNHKISQNQLATIVKSPDKFQLNTRLKMFNHFSRPGNSQEEMKKHFSQEDYNNLVDDFIASHRRDANGYPIETDNYDAITSNRGYHTPENITKILNLGSAKYNDALLTSVDPKLLNDEHFDILTDVAEDAVNNRARGYNHRDMVRAMKKHYDESKRIAIEKPNVDQEPI